MMVPRVMNQLWVLTKQPFVTSQTSDCRWKGLTKAPASNPLHAITTRIPRAPSMDTCLGSSLDTKLLLPFKLLQKLKLSRYTLMSLPLSTALNMAKQERLLIKG